MGKITAGPTDFVIATTKTSHMAPGPPTPSGGPAPTPSGQFIPAPYLYMARSEKLHGMRSRLEFEGGKAVVHESYLDVENPGNMPAKPGEMKPTGGDLANMAIIGIAQVSATLGSRTYSKTKKFAVTMDGVKLCIPGEGADKRHLSEGVFVNGAAPGMSLKEMSKWCADVTQTGDPIDVVTGAVLDERRDLLLPGVIELCFLRTYDSSRARARSPFGCCGFTHNYDRWVEIDEGEQACRVRQEDGRFVTLPLPPRGGASYSRAKRITLQRTGDDYALRNPKTGLTAYFDLDRAPGARGDRALLRAVRDAWGNEIRLEYEDGRLVRIHDTAHREIRLLHDSERRIARAEVWGPTAFVDAVADRLQLLEHVDYAYDNEGDLVLVKDALGHEQRYVYDAHHRLVEKTLPNGVAFRYVYDDERDRCVQSAADGGLQNVELYFDDQKKTTTVHGTPEPRRFAYDARGVVVDARTLDGSYSDTLVVDDDQLILSRTNAAGDETLWEHDERGHPVRLVRADGSETSFEWQEDRLLARIDPGGRHTRFEYDGRGALVRRSEPSGRWRAFDLDRSGRVASIRDARGVVFAFGYDAQHNLVRETNARGAVTEYTYDAMGRITSRRDALGRVRSMAYDALGRPVQDVLPDGTRLTYAWDGMGNIVEASDGATTDSASYSGTGFVSERTLVDGSTWRMVGDRLERLRELHNPRGEAHRIHFDRAGRIIEQLFFDGQVVRYRWGRNGRIARTDYPDESWIERTYDPVGQVVEEKRPDGAATYERNEIGWPVAITATEHFGDILTELAYDIDGRPLVVAVDGRRIAYAYDELGRRVSRTLPNGEVTRYAYDVGGALVSVQHGAETITFERDVLGREVKRSARSSGVEVHSVYDADDRLAAITAARSDGGIDGEDAAIVRRSWKRGPHARLAQIHDQRWGQRTLVHDRRGRLLGWQRGAASIRYGYDAAGYLDLIEDYRPERGTTDARRLALRMGNLVVGSGDVRFEYDARLRRSRRRDASGETRYFWDAKSRLREVHLPDGQQIHFAYDAFDHLTRELAVDRPDPETPGRKPEMTWTDYVWDGDELAMTIDSSGRERVFVHEPGTLFPILQQEGGESFLYLTDPLGVPTELIDAKGRVAAAWLFGPFGEPIEVTRDPGRAAAVETPFRLLGQIFHPSVNLCSTLYRWFDPSVARWLTSDPIGLSGGTDLYGFDGSPTERVDKLGLYTSASFESFMNDTRVARIQANIAALSKQNGGDPEGENAMGPATAGAAVPFAPGQPAASTSQNDGSGLHGHAERNPLTRQQGGAQDGSAGVGAVGAGRPHCGHCTQAIIDTPGSVPSSRIRGETTNRQGESNDGYPIPGPDSSSAPGKSGDPSGW